MSRSARSPDALAIEDLHKSFGALKVLKGISASAEDGDVPAPRSVRDPFAEPCPGSG